MTPTDPPQGYEPVAGESRLALVASSVLLGIGALGTLAVLVAMLWVDDLGPTLTTCLVVLAVSVFGFGYSLWKRRNYLRDRRSGVPLERRPWTGEQLGPPL
jgi:hypothetical protein